MAFFAADSAESFRKPPGLEGRGEEAHPRAGTAQVAASSRRGCVLVSAQLHVGHLRVRVCCVLDL